MQSNCGSFHTQLRFQLWYDLDLMLSYTPFGDKMHKCSMCLSNYYCDIDYNYLRLLHVHPSKQNNYHAEEIMPVSNQDS